MLEDLNINQFIRLKKTEWESVNGVKLLGAGRSKFNPNYKIHVLYHWAQCASVRIYQSVYVV